MQCNDGSSRKYGIAFVPNDRGKPCTTRVAEIVMATCFISRWHLGETTTAC
jgi:hypothetical protein